MPIIFHNPGLIDPRCITTMGVNVKPASDNPIGFFGTGLKYAIAVLLREGQEITIWRGDEPLNFTLQKTDIRGKEFSLVLMNGRELGFTTELGKNWKVWQAYRELYCNAVDEGGGVFESAVYDDARVERKPDVTSIVCRGALIEEAHRERRDFLLLDEAFVKIPGLEIHTRNGKSIFYRGIAVSALQKRSINTYNILDHVGLTEDRTATNPWWLPHQIGHALQASTDKQLLRRILTAKPDTFEYSLSFTESSTTSEEFLEVIAEELEHNAVGVNNSARELFRAKRGEFMEKIQHFEPTSIESQQFQTAKFFAAAIGFPIDDYPIILAERIGDGVLGLAHNNTIYISRAAFERGTKIVAGTLIEEFIHLREGFKDETRALQDFLLNKVVSLGERLQGRPL